MMAEQSAALAQFLPFLAPANFHHGCCIGADEQAHFISLAIPGITPHLHRSVDASQMAQGMSGIEWPPAHFLKRNRSIVRHSKLLIAAPSGPEEHRSGTWSTVRYARRIGRPIVLIAPSGEIIWDRWPVASPV